MSRLADILPSQYIQVRDQIEDWQTAVQVASQALVADGRIKEGYVDNMIKSVEDNGPYMVLSDYFALMHAQPDENVILESMSLLVVKEPVDLAGKPVKIFLVLVAKDSQSHLEHLQEIVSVFMDEDDFATILEGDKKAIVALFA